MTTRTLILAASLLALAACSDNPIGSDGADASSASFTYTGPKSGSFQVKSDPNRYQSPLAQTFAFGMRDPNGGGISIQSVLQRSGKMADWMSIGFPTQTPGTFVIDTESCPVWKGSCPGFVVAFDLPSDDDGSAKYSCQINTGTMRLIAVTATRASGEFSGTGTCFVEGSDDEPPFTVTDGRFDVKLTDATAAAAERRVADRPILPG